jgi:hypothetical protein
VQAHRCLSLWSDWSQQMQGGEMKELIRAGRDRTLAGAIRERLSYANVVATLSLFLVLSGGAAIAATGGNFILGKPNSASSTTSLSAATNGKALQVTNMGTGTAATALGLNTASGHPPLTVSSGARVTNLNADKLDGLSSAAFVKTANEPVHVVDAPGEPGFQNNYANYGSGFSTVGFYKDSTGIVHLRGTLVKTTGTFDGSAVYTLPAGYRPPQILSMPAAVDSGSGALQINTDGSVIVYCWTGPCTTGVGGVGVGVGMDGLTFRAG